MSRFTQRWGGFCNAKKLLLLLLDSLNSGSNKNLAELTDDEKWLGSYNFEIEALNEHLEFYLQLFTAANKTGFVIPDVGVLLTAFDEARYNTLQTFVVETIAKNVY